MKNARRIFFSTLVLTAITVLNSCTSCPFAGKQAGQVDHCVFVWLKKPGNAADREKLVEAARMFAREIPEVKKLSVGQMLPSQRPIVDSTFDVGFIMRFADKAAMDRYEQHPVHQKAVKQLLMPMAKKVQVYDLVVE
jgi:hypothetical protein